MDNNLDVEVDVRKDNLDVDLGKDVRSPRTETLRCDDERDVRRGDSCGVGKFWPAVKTSSSAPPTPLATAPWVRVAISLLDNKYCSNSSGTGTLLGTRVLLYCCRSSLSLVFKRSINTLSARPLYSCNTLTKSKSGLSKSAIPVRNSFMVICSSSPANSLNNLFTSRGFKPKFILFSPSAY